MIGLIEHCGEPQRTGPIEKPRWDRICECFHCKEQDVCTPRTDFYTLAGWDDGPLFCENCITGIVCGKITPPTKP